MNRRFLCGICCFVYIASSLAWADPIRMYPVDDRSGSEEGELRPQEQTVLLTGYGGSWGAIFEFDLTEIPDGMEVMDAEFFTKAEFASGSALASTIEFFAYEGDGVADLNDLQRMDHSLGLFQMFDQEHLVDTTDVVESFRGNGVEYLGIVARSSTGATAFLSKEIADALDHLRPTLTVSPVPEPSMFWGWAICAAAMMFLRRRG